MSGLGLGRQLQVRVKGIPAPQGSKVRNRYGAVYESSKAVGPWREAIRGEVQRVMAERVPFTGPVLVRVLFWLPRPKAHWGTGRNAGLVKVSAPEFPAGVPDLDKLCRAVLDGLTAGGAWKDDAQVVHLDAWKRYADGMAPGCDVLAWEEL